MYIRKYKKGGRLAKLKKAAALMALCAMLILPGCTSQQSGDPLADYGADAALLTSGSLASPAWGAKQLERILALYRERTANWTTALNPAGLTLEERAALDAPLLEIQEAGMLIHIAPGEGDLSPSEAFPIDVLDIIPSISL